MKKNLGIIYLAGFLISLPIALTAYINSSFLEEYVDAKHLGLIYSIASFLTVVFILKTPDWLNKYGNRKVTKAFGWATLISFVLLATVNQKAVALLSFVTYFMMTNLVVFNLDIFVENFSNKNAIGKWRGLYLTILNLAWVFAQLISGSIIDRSSFSGIYLFSALIVTLFLSIFFLFLKDYKDPSYSKMPVKKTIKKFFRRANLGKIYTANMILKFFYSWMVIYTPIYLHEVIGFAWNQMGLIFAIMLLPFVFLSFPLGRWSDKIGEKEMLIGGFLIAALFTSIIPLIKEQNLWLWALLLFATRVGAATIEVMSETYFFKQVGEEDADAISFFRTTTPIAYILGPLFATLSLLFIPSFEYLFYALGAVMLFGLYAILRLKDTA